MGIANKVINILVLIAAIGAAVCAFLLWQKREQITKGREMLSEAIIQAVDKIGPKGQVKKESMSIKEEADKLKDPISALQKNVEKICSQRDEIAKAFAEVVNKVNSLPSSEKGDDIKAEDLIDYGKSSAKSKEGKDLVAKRVSYYEERNDIMKSGLQEISSALKIDDSVTDANFLDNEALKNYLSAQSKRAKDLVARCNNYSKHIGMTTDKLQDAVGKDVKLQKPSLGLKNKNWEKELSANKAGISAATDKLKSFRIEGEKLKKEIESLKKQLSENEALLKKKDEEIEGINGKLTAANTEIKRLRKIIDPSSEGEETESTSGTAAQKTDDVSFKKLVGKVTYVNPTYGFVAIDLGTKSTVKGIGIDGKPVDRIVPLPANSIMTVATSLDPADAKYVARVVVVRIGTDSSIANVLPLPGSDLPKVGDIVFFSDSDLRQMREIREIELKQKKEAGVSENGKAASDAEGTKKAESSAEKEEEEEESAKSAKPAKKASSGNDDDEE